LPLLLPSGLKKIEAHREEGHLVALLSSTPSYVAQPLARTLNLDAAGATHFEVKGGQFTGELLGPACFGRGKVHWAERLGNDHGLDVGASWFYTDSYTDMPMLERVKNPVVINPDPRLKKAARDRGWRTEDWIGQAPTNR
jgi:HAD superfamily hydrolase (TIGR01490 family)